MSETKEVQIIDPKNFGLEETQAGEITKGLTTIIQERDVLAESYKSVIDMEITPENLPKFKALRLQILKNRTTGLKAWHKANKAYFLAGGNFVQAIYNKEVAENERMEGQLMEAEKHFETLEKERLEQLQKDREEEVGAYIDDASERNLSGMEQDVWAAYLEAKRKAFQDELDAKQKAKEEREEKLEAEKAEQERIRKENEELKKAADLKAKQDEEERLERERVAKIEADKRAKVEADRNAQAKKEREEQEAKLKAERLERERIQKELDDKKAAEEKAKTDEAAKIQVELNKGDSAKVKDLLKDLESLKTKYSFKSQKNQLMYRNTGGLIDKVITYINKK